MAVLNGADNVEMARQDAPEQPLGPGFQRLGQKRVIGIGQRRAGQINRRINLQPMHIHQQPYQFRPGNGRMRVIELDGHVIGQFGNVITFRQEPAQQVLNGGGGKEILLFQAQFLAAFGGVIGIKHAGDGTRQSLGRVGRHIVAAVEAGQIEHIHRLGIPQAQRVGPFAFPPHGGRVKGGGENAFPRGPDGFATLFAHMTAKTDLIGHFGALEFPDMALFQPAFGDLHLLTIGEMLLEQPVFIADTIAIGRDFQRGERIHKTGRQTAQPAIAQRRIGFIGDNRIVFLT